jgi:hypothetical protein
VLSDRYWKLKPRRAELRQASPRPWLKKMNYQPTFQPVFAEVPEGWKARWRLIREFVERWFGFPMGDVGGQRSRVKQVEKALQLRLPPALQEWVAYVSDLAPRRRFLRNDHEFRDLGESILIMADHESRIGFLVSKKKLTLPDPPAIWVDMPMDHRGLIPHVTTLAFQYLMQFWGPWGWKGAAGLLTAKVSAPKPLLRDLTKAFPVQSKFDDVLSFESDNMVARLGPDWFNASTSQRFEVQVREPVSREQIPNFLLEMNADYSDGILDRRA